MKPSLLPIFLLFSVVTANAYPFNDSLDSFPAIFYRDGIAGRTNGASFNYNIPISGWPKVVSFSTVRGADGGRAKATADAGKDKTAEGGGGALLSCKFNIHPTDANALRPGGELRIVIGSKGESKTRNEDAGGGGGGATGILYRAPTLNATWEPLVIAGGGGGGAASTFVTGTFSDRGSNANTSTAADDSYADGGTNGNSGQSVNPRAGGGGGWKTSNPDYNGGYGGRDTNGISAGGRPYNKGTYGGFGCGAGGAGWALSTFSETACGGGGGGGYSGGGAGDDNDGGSSSKAAGGGGGSYIDSRAFSITANTRNGTNSHGAVACGFDSFLTGPRISGPTITLLGFFPLIIYDFEQYTEAGALASDVYGNSISIPSPTGSVSGSPGTYHLTYTATDQFGQVATATRTVQVVSANKPTFKLSDDVVVPLNSGVYSASGFARNFNANDAEQSLSSYVLTNDNGTLFSEQPTIDTSGRLSFKPGAGQFGQATVTVKAIDNPNDPNNGTSDPVTFTVSVTTSKPTFSLSGDVAVDENSGAYSKSSFVTNFNANDTGQSLKHYTVSNNNSSLFTESGQPSINTSGTLTFTTAADIFGSATVTVVAVDNQDDSNNGTSNPATFTLSVKEVPTPPSFSILGNQARDRDAGIQTVANFASGFSSNDAGETFSRYELSNNNTSLFSSQPSINSAGTLTFTPAGDVFGAATVTVVGYDSGIANNSTQKTFTLTIREIAPVAAFTFNKTLTLPGDSVQFTSTSTGATGWSWDFDNNGTVDSTEQHPSHTYTSAGSFNPSLTVSNTVANNILVSSDTIRVVSYGIINSRFDSTEFANGSGTEESLGLGWYGKNGDDGDYATPDWSTGQTTGTSGILTQIKSSGSATRMGQFFSNNLTGNQWTLAFDLGNTNSNDIGSFRQMRLFGGTLSDSPSGTVLANDNGAPHNSLVDSSGWTQLLHEVEIEANGTVVFHIDQDLGQFNVMAIQFRSEGQDTGTTFDNFAFVQQVAPAAVADSFDGTSEETISDTVFTNDSAAALNAPLAISAVNGDVSKLGTELALSSGALLTVLADGTFTYDSNGAFQYLSPGSTSSDSFTYTLGTGSLTSTATVTLRITNPDPAESFRDTYGLAADGSEDDDDWSGNGIANIYYFAFGLGDPNSKQIDTSRLPQISASTNNQITFSHVFRIDQSSITVSALTSKDLQNWTSISTLPAEEFPTSIGGVDLDGTYRRITYTLPVASDVRFFSVRAKSRE